MWQCLLGLGQATAIQHLAVGAGLWNVCEMNNFANNDSNSFQTLRNPLAELFQPLRDGPDYSTQFMKTQLAVWFRGAKVGGLNYSRWHFFISKVFVRNHGSSELLEDYGFTLIEHSKTHQYWKLDGAENHQLFRVAIEAMTESQINVR